LVGLPLTADGPEKHADLVGYLFIVYTHFVDGLPLEAP